jgi:hypothetical protein
VATESPIGICGVQAVGSGVRDFLVGCGGGNDRRCGTRVSLLRLPKQESTGIQTIVNRN